MAARLASAADAVRAASANLDRLNAQPAPMVAVDQVRADLALAQAGYAFRDAIRQEQEIVYTLASQPDLEAATLQVIGGPRAAELGSIGQALRALWDMAGLWPGSVHPRHNKRFAASEPLSALLGYYRTSASRTGIDWSYLAAINYVESDFGRTNGPSSAGAVGPMQFLPTTFSEYGSGDINSSRDSIAAAARLLARNGAPDDYDRAILRYNHSKDYVTAIQGYAAALRSDTLWLSRLYYWSTFG